MAGRLADKVAIVVEAGGPPSLVNASRVIGRGQSARVR